MADNNKVAAELREKFGKGFARRLRADGKIPAVIYGHGAEPLHVALPAHRVGLLLRKANAILELDLDGTTHLTLVKDVQKDPVRQIIEHLDLIVVRKGEKVEVEVPVHLEGETYPGTIAMLDLNNLRLQAEATNIPERIVISVEGLEEGTQIHAKDVELPSGSVLVDDEDLLVVNVIVPSAGRGEDEEESEAAEETTEAAPAEAAE
ncbi:50S ribosomal protein L25/general stress protein Ctc [Glaciibacter superstes]|uniref:50S ribosomal protein L25/general stress protein Ctc n=1 Tax=Glaciibacter superstes TaxID=501023 RepID=UPI0003B4011D|nr:50S ribosomal protein L25/general stress protein Ctc [Glaciibacter superstes]